MTAEVAPLGRLLAPVISDQINSFLKSPLATIIWDPGTGTILTSNTAAYDLLGYRENDLIGSSMFRILQSDSKTGICANTRNSAVEVSIEVADQEFFWQGQNARLLFITDRTHASRTELQLQEALKTAERALRVKTDFLSTMSHEIRTPLNGIIGLVGMLAETDLNREQGDYVSTIQSSSEILLSVINNIFDYSKIEHAMISLESLDFDLQTTLEDVFELFAGPAKAKGLVLRYELDKDVPHYLRGDEGRLKQVLLNLLSNAIKFTGAGSVHLDIKRTDPASRILRFEIRDSGIGISPEGLKGLFDNFSQADPSITRRSGGTGLGLAICKALVHLMNGEMGVESTVGKGSCFWFTVEFSGMLLRAPGDGFESLAGLKVLLVQRNEDERQSTRSVLESMGMLVTEAGNAPQALSIYARSSEDSMSFAYCLVDLDLPVIDGMKLARLLQAQKGTRAINIILLVPPGAVNRLPEARDAGAADVLFKPVRQRQLLRSFTLVSASKQQADQRAGIRIPAICTENRTGLGSVLVVEDNPVNQMVAAHCLRKLGYSVVIAEDGLEALEVFGKAAFDLILMDCHMPGMDGVTAATKIRLLGRLGAAIPILALTADTSQAERDRCAAAGMNDFLSKPIRPADLKSKLEQWLQKPN